MKTMMIAVFVTLIATCALAQTDEQKRNEKWQHEGLQQEEYTRYVPAGTKREIQFIYGSDTDCVPMDGIEVRITTQPEHGTIEVVTGEGWSAWPKENLRFKCNAKKTRGQIVKYKAEKGYTGPDVFEVLILFPRGYAREIRWNLNVK
jgi:hypothetical protein